MHWMRPESAGPPRVVEVLLERGDEVGLPPAVAVDEDGGLRGEEEAAEGEGEDGEDGGEIGWTHADDVDGHGWGTRISGARVKSRAMRGSRKASSG